MRKGNNDLGMYNLPYDEVIEHIKGNLRGFYEVPSSAYCEPFPIINNLYYVGDRQVCAHLIDTKDGLILFDAGYQHTVHMLIQSIWSLGFDPADIKYLILSHGHFDHFGACNELRALYGIKSFMSRADCDMLRSTPEASLLYLNPNPYAKLPVVDYEFEDGEVLHLGNIDIECALSPGHSPGTTSFFFDMEDKDRIYKVGYFGGTGFLTLYRDYLQKYRLPLDLREKYKQTINKLKSRNVDIVLGNHPSQNFTFEKLSVMQGGAQSNAFIDPGEWNSFLENLEEQYEIFLEKGY